MPRPILHMFMMPLLLALLCGCREEVPFPERRDAGDGGGGDVEDASGEMGPCGGVCSGATPVCDLSAGVCVECVGSGDCAGGVCDPITNTCVECLGSGDCTEAGLLECELGTNTCVGCTETGQCGDVTASKCENNACGACRDDGDCAHLAGTPYCEEGTCVGCRPATEGEACRQGDGTVYSCDPSTFTCTTTEVGSVPDCGACASDSECPSGYGCVGMEFQGQGLDGGYCLLRLNAAPGGVCPLPYTGGVVTRSSLNGIQGVQYCGILEQFTTCAAIRARITSQGCTLTMDDECGVVGLDDGLCRAVPGEGHHLHVRVLRARPLHLKQVRHRPTQPHWQELPVRGAWLHPSLASLYSTHVHHNLLLTPLPLEPLMPRPILHMFMMPLLLALLCGCREEVPFPERRDAGGAGGDVGDASGEMGPCGGVCSGATPVCDLSAGVCVECVGSGDCAGGVCDPMTNTCVECLGSGDCTEAGLLECELETNTCVGCTETGQCGDVTASKCENNACGACTDDGDCAHLAGTPYCEGGVCVGCRPATEGTDCASGGKIFSCDPVLFACTTTEVGSLTDCRACVSDSECAGPRKCIPLLFGAGMEARGTYCAKEADVAVGCGLATRPYGTAVTATSVGGHTATYCTIAQGGTTCEAVLDATSFEGTGAPKECSKEGEGDDECGVVGLDDGLCRKIGGVGKARCTYPCNGTEQCKTLCNTAPSPAYCQ